METRSDECILIVGGAGYIGSHTNKMLSNSGYKTIVLDNLIYGHLEFVKWGIFIEGDIADKTILEFIFSNYNIQAVMHFSAFAYVGESVNKPSKYYNNNVVNTINLLDAMVEHNVTNFIFSSTCATFGEPEYIPVDENHPQKPLSPYGKTKLIVEEILADYEVAYGLKHIILRYFNAAGADPDCEIGEDHTPETHLIPLVLDAAMGKRDNISIFGTDYDTKDGTCVRDYIHINDLAKAHMLGLEWMLKNKKSNNFNLGNGEGFSVKQIIDVAKKVTGNNISVNYAERRGGDPATVVGSYDKVEKVLGWKPEFKNIERIIETAWSWHLKRHEIKLKKVG